MIRAPEGFRESPEETVENPGREVVKQDPLW